MDTPDGPVGTMPERHRRQNRVEARQRNVAALLLLHWTYEQIARYLSVSKATIAADVKVIRRQWREANAEDYQTFVDEHYAVLAELEAVVLPEALTLSDKGRVRLWAVDRAIQIRDRIEQLKGLNVPAKLEVTLKVEMIGQAFVETCEELGVDAERARPIFAGRLRAIEAAAS
jgi:hypothetical protein